MEALIGQLLLHALSQPQQPQQQSYYQQQPYAITAPPAYTYYQRPVYNVPRYYYPPQQYYQPKYGVGAYSYSYAQGGKARATSKATQNITTTTINNARHNGKSLVEFPPCFPFCQ
jgi:hypothetical protein